MYLRSFKHLIFTCLLTFAVSTSADNINLPDFGDSAGRLISPEIENVIGREFLRQIRLSAALVDDPEINEYIRALGQKLADNSDNPSQSFTFFVIDSPDINAFAAPGGYIGINAGLILASETESELASVMGHEIAHVTQRHLARAIEAQDQLSIPSIVGLVAALLIGTQNSELGSAALAATQGASAQAQLNFIRSNENEADFIGIQTLARAGLDPHGMPAFFERLQQASRYYGRPPEFLSTHPVTVTRIANSQARAREFGFRQVADSVDYHFVREKLRLRLNKRDMVKYYQAVLKTGQHSNQTASQYAYCLALARDGNYKEAEKQLAPLIKADPQRLNYLLARARLQIAQGNFQQGIKQYRQLMKDFPQDHTVTLYFSKALIDLKQGEEARTILHEHLRFREADAEYYKLMSSAEDAAGYPLEAHQSLAEFHYLNGQTRSAIRQLDIALGLKIDNFFEKSKIQARRDQLKGISLGE